MIFYKSSISDIFHGFLFSSLILDEFELLAYRFELFSEPLTFFKKFRVYF